MINTTLFIKNIDTIDLALWKDNALKGASFHVSVKVFGDLDQNGFICDFSVLKKAIKSILKSKIDHKFIAPINCKDYGLSQDPLDNDYLVWKPKNFDHDNPGFNTWYYRAPKESIFIIDCDHVSSDYLQSWLSSELRLNLQSDYSIDVSSQITLTQQFINPEHGYFYYTHGITNHQGHCHRLWHGHHSKLQVYVDHILCKDLQKLLIDKYMGGGNFHLACESQLKASSKWKIGEFGEYGKSCEIFYTNYKRQTYNSILPANNVLLVKHSTSIETLAKAMFNVLLKECDCKIHHKLKLEIYEGINKGASCEIDYNRTNLDPQKV